MKLFIAIAQSVLLGLGCFLIACSGPKENVSTVEKPYKQAVSGPKENVSTVEKPYKQAVHLASTPKGKVYVVAGGYDGNTERCYIYEPNETSFQGSISCVRQ